MDTRDAGRKGGQSRSDAKRAASARNLELARRIRAQMSETEAHVADLSAKVTRDLTAERFLEDARWILEHPTPPGEPQVVLDMKTRQTVVLVAQAKAESR